MTERITDKILGESYLKVEHPSGLKIYLAKKSGFSSYYAIFGTAYGSIDTCFSRNGGKAVSVPEGIAHFLEHKLFESEELDAFQLFSKTGAYANAYTSFDRTCYLFGCSSKFEENLKILLEFVQSPYFTAETVKKEQGIIGQEIVMYEDDPEWRVMFNLLKILYHKHPVRIDIAGTVESISHIDDKLLYECYNTFYNLSNMFLCLVGDFDEEEILHIIDENLKVGEKVEIKRETAAEDDSIVEGYTEQKLAVANPLFMIGFKDKSNSGYVGLRRRVAMDILLEMLCGTASPLYKRLSDEGLIGNGIDHEYFCTRDMAAVLISGEGDKSAEILEKLMEEAENIRKKGLDSELFEIIRKSKYGECVSAFDNVQSIASMLVSSHITGDKLFDEMEILRSITTNDVYECLEVFSSEKCARSVVKGE